MKVTLWGTRGSLPTPGCETLRYGGNTSCVEVVGEDGTRLVLDAGTGIRRLSNACADPAQRVDVMLTHLHLDHIQGLGFFQPLDEPGREIHIWGPPCTQVDLGSRLSRYLSPPLFPARLTDLGARLTLHDAPLDGFEIGSLRIEAALVCHPGTTLGYRISEGGRTLTYIPDHEPALGRSDIEQDRQWISGFELAHDADLLIHDSQYSLAEYSRRAGWGHSALSHALSFAAQAGARRFVTFHHDPSHEDTMLDDMLAQTCSQAPAGLEVIPGVEGASFQL